MNSKYVKLGAALVLAIVAIAGWWFLYYTKTPTYSLGLVKTAINQHDIETFKKHVDLDTFMDSAIDDFINSDDNVAEMKDNPFASGLLQMLKPTLIDYSKKQIYALVEKGTDEGVKNKPQNEGDSGIANNMPSVSNKSFIGIGETKKSGKTATVELKVNDEEIGGEFTFVVAMRELNDGTWQVTKINNLVDYLNAVKEAHKQQLKEYLEAYSTAWDENGYGKEVYTSANAAQANPTAENIKRFIEARGKANESVDKLPVPAGAKEFDKLRKEREENLKKAYLIYLKYIEQGSVTPEEDKQYGELMKKANEVYDKVLKIRKTIDPNYDPEKSVEKYKQ